MLRLASVVLLLLACACGVYAEFVNPVYTARLDASQVISGVGDEDTIAVAVCQYIRYSSPANIQCSLQSDYILTQTSIVNVAIYYGQRGVAGPLLYQFNPNSFSLTYNTANLNLTNLNATTVSSNYTVSQQLQDFLNGYWYIQIDVTLPNYSIRGQLEHSDRLYAILTSTQTVPSSGNTNSYGVALAVYTYNQPRRTLAFEIVHSVSDPTALEFRLETNGNYGEFAFSLNQYVSPIFESVLLTVDEQVSMLADALYAQVDSPNYPFGEIRGQAVFIDYLPPVQLTSRLDGTQTIPVVNTVAIGCGLVYFDCSTSTLEFLLFHSVGQPTAAYIYFGNQTNLGTVVQQLPSAQSPIYGSFLLTTTQAEQLFNQSYYFQVDSVPFPTGEIRGEISTTFPYYSYLSGINANPPVTTASVGCATYRIIGDTINKLDFNIQFNVGTPQFVYLFEGSPDVNGPLNRVLSNTPINTAVGDGQLLSSRDVALLTTGRLYIQVNSVRFPTGELRGQILPIDPYQCGLSVIGNSNTTAFVFPPPVNLPPRNDVGVLLPSVCALLVVLLSTLLL